MTDKEKRELKDGIISIFKRFNIFDHTATIGGLRDDILKFINSLQEEPVSEDLEIAANEWDAKASFTPFYMALDDKGNPYEVRQDYTTHVESFKAGAKWMKLQMMAKAIDGYVIEDIEEGNGDFLLSANYLPKSMGLKDQQRVKVIVIKED